MTLLYLLLLRLLPEIYVGGPAHLGVIMFNSNFKCQLIIQSICFFEVLNIECAYYCMASSYPMYFMLSDSSLCNKILIGNLLSVWKCVNEIRVLERKARLCINSSWALRFNVHFLKVHGL